jgi:hypothetical protein
MVAKAQPQVNQIQRLFMGRNEVKNKRKKIAKAAAFGPADKNALTGADAP